MQLQDIEPIALSAKAPLNFSDQCSAFISSDINTAFQEGISKEDIIAGLVYSICINYLNRVKGARQTGTKIFMQGGVCYNKAVPIAMAGMLGREIIVPPEPGLMGAYGVALEIRDSFEKEYNAPSNFSLEELIARDVKQLKPFICHGTAEKCDRRCEITLMEVDGKKVPFGGACNKYYNIIHKKQVNIEKLNHIDRRTELLYKEWNTAPRTTNPEAITVGLNGSFQINISAHVFTFSMNSAQK